MIFNYGRPEGTERRPRPSSEVSRNRGLHATQDAERESIVPSSQTERQKCAEKSHAHIDRQEPNYITVS